ncbi:putative dual adapter for phosphotyrosine and 3-phosphotyrosine and 3-phosphoinositide [Paratrimastix pyriformis]|uniref:Dual adapter for phosphotyrosine and 3-phosphotyrosine and 3-phosphoinositide n=1 Tax=Paratrimastix pyriformis TaxID=342808 RepID=A0ABQ8UAL9_9EUKA|nr:putative dual adapter for phosphotyrosine and 3-phosphotyrosine and 3-phosphoinositide [Paratrimastix pyriformis]
MSKSGWLIKEGGGFKSWRKRWMILDPTTKVLSYYASKVANSNDSSCPKPLGVISLGDGSPIEFVPKQESGKDHCFCIKSPLRSFLLCAETAEDAQDWMAALRAVSTADTHLSDVKGPLLTGWLTKEAGSRINWKRRWFVLLQDRLEYYKSKTDDTPAGSIVLNEARAAPLGTSGGAPASTATATGAPAPPGGSGATPPPGLPPEGAEGSERSRRPFAFMVATPERTLYLQAAQQDEMNLWLSKIGIVIASHARVLAPPTLSVMANPMAAQRGSMTLARPIVIPPPDDDDEPEPEAGEDIDLMLPPARPPPAAAPNPGSRRESVDSLRYEEDDDDGLAPGPDHPMAPAPIPDVEEARRRLEASIVALEAVPDEMRFFQPQLARSLIGPDPPFLPGFDDETAGPSPQQAEARDSVKRRTSPRRSPASSGSAEGELRSFEEELQARVVCEERQERRLSEIRQVLERHRATALQEREAQLMRTEAATAAQYLADLEGTEAAQCDAARQELTARGQEARAAVRAEADARRIEAARRLRGTTDRVGTEAGAALGSRWAETHSQLLQRARHLLGSQVQGLLTSQQAAMADQRQQLRIRQAAAFAERLRQVRLAFVHRRRPSASPPASPSSPRGMSLRLAQYDLRRAATRAGANEGSVRLQDAARCLRTSLSQPAEAAQLASRVALDQSARRLRDAASARLGSRRGELAAQTEAALAGRRLDHQPRLAAALEASMATLRTRHAARLGQIQNGQEAFAKRLTGARASRATQQAELLSAEAARFREGLAAAASRHRAALGARQMRLAEERARALAELTGQLQAAAQERHLALLAQWTDQRAARSRALRQAWAGLHALLRSAATTSAQPQLAAPAGFIAAARSQLDARRDQLRAAGAAREEALTKALEAARAERAAAVSRQGALARSQAVAAFGTCRDQRMALLLGASASTAAEAAGRAEAALGAALGAGRLAQAALEAAPRGWAGARAEREAVLRAAWVDARQERLRGLEASLACGRAAALDRCRSLAAAWQPTFPVGRCEAASGQAARQLAAARATGGRLLEANLHDEALSMAAVRVAMLHVPRPACPLPFARLARERADRVRALAACFERADKDRASMALLRCAGGRARLSAAAEAACSRRRALLRGWAETLGGPLAQATGCALERAHLERIRAARAALQRRQTRDGRGAEGSDLGAIDHVAAILARHRAALLGAFVRVAIAPNFQADRWPRLEAAAAALTAAAQGQVAALSARLRLARRAVREAALASWARDTQTRRQEQQEALAPMRLAEERARALAELTGQLQAAAQERHLALLAQWTDQRAARSRALRQAWAGLHALLRSAATTSAQPQLAAPAGFIAAARSQLDARRDQLRAAGAAREEALTKALEAARAERAAARMALLLGASASTAAEAAGRAEAALGAALGAGRLAQVEARWRAMGAEGRAALEAAPRGWAGARAEREAVLRAAWVDARQERLRGLEASLACGRAAALDRCRSLAAAWQPTFPVGRCEAASGQAARQLAAARATGGRLLEANLHDEALSMAAVRVAMLHVPRPACPLPFARLARERADRVRALAACFERADKDRASMALLRCAGGRARVLADEQSRLEGARRAQLDALRAQLSAAAEAACSRRRALLRGWAETLGGPLAQATGCALERAHLERIRAARAALQRRQTRDGRGAEGSDLGAIDHVAAILARHRAALLGAFVRVAIAPNFQADRWPRLEAAAAALTAAAQGQVAALSARLRLARRAVREAALASWARDTQTRRQEQQEALAPVRAEALARASRATQQAELLSAEAARFREGLAAAASRHRAALGARQMRLAEERARALAELTGQLQAAAQERHLALLAQWTDQRAARSRALRQAWAGLHALLRSAATTSAQPQLAAPAGFIAAARSQLDARRDQLRAAGAAREEALTKALEAARAERAAAVSRQGALARSQAVAAFGTCRDQRMALLLGASASTAAEAAGRAEAALGAALGAGRLAQVEARWRAMGAEGRAALEAAPRGWAGARAEREAVLRAAWVDARQERLRGLEASLACGRAAALDRCRSLAAAWQPDLVVDALRGLERHRSRLAALREAHRVAQSCPGTRPAEWDARRQEAMAALEADAHQARQRCIDVTGALGREGRLVLLAMAQAAAWSNRARCLADARQQAAHARERALRAARAAAEATEAKKAAAEAAEAKKAAAEAAEAKKAAAEAAEAKKAAAEAAEACPMAAPGVAAPAAHVRPDEAPVQSAPPSLGLPQQQQQPPPKQAEPETPQVAQQPPVVPAKGCCTIL